MKNLNEIKLAQELIRFPTIKTEDKGIMKFLKKKISSIGFKCKIIKSKGFGTKPTLNLFAKFYAEQFDRTNLPIRTQKIYNCFLKRIIFYLEKISSIKDLTNN